MEWLAMNSWSGLHPSSPRWPSMFWSKFDSYSVILVTSPVVFLVILRPVASDWHNVFPINRIILEQYKLSDVFITNLQHCSLSSDSHSSPRGFDLSTSFSLLLIWFSTLICLSYPCDFRLIITEDHTGGCSLIWTSIFHIGFCLQFSMIEKIRSIRLDLGTTFGRYILTDSSFAETSPGV